MPRKAQGPVPKIHILTVKIKESYDGGVNNDIRFSNLINISAKYPIKKVMSLNFVLKCVHIRSFTD